MRVICEDCDRKQRVLDDVIAENLALTEKFRRFEWQPIETIQFPCLVRMDSKIYPENKYAYAIIKHSSDLMDYGLHTITHWMPLPSAPEPPTTKGETK